MNRHIDPEQEVLTCNEAAVLLRRHRKTVYNLVRAGRLPGAKVGRDWLFKRSELMKLLETRASDETAANFSEEAMKGKGLRAERETIINFNEEDETASIWTASEVVYRRLLKRLGRAYLTEDGERHAEFKFPAKFLDLPRIKAKKELTSEQKEIMALQLARNRKVSQKVSQTDN